MDFATTKFYRPEHRLLQRDCLVNHLFEEEVCQNIGVMSFDIKAESIYFAFKTLVVGSIVPTNEDESCIHRIISGYNNLCQVEKSEK